MKKFYNIGPSFFKLRQSDLSAFLLLANNTHIGGIVKGLNLFKCIYSYYVFALFTNVVQNHFGRFLGLKSFPYVESDLEIFHIRCILILTCS